MVLTDEERELIEEEERFRWAARAKAEKAAAKPGRGNVRQRQPMNNRWRFALLLCGTLACMCLIGEAMARLAGVAPLQLAESTVPMRDTSWGERDPEIGWINNPGVHRATEPGNASMTFWGLGRRATRPSEPHDCPKGRLFIIGDSWTQAYGVADEETYAWKLQEKHPDYCVENFGNGGFGVLQTLQLLERALHESPESPKLVILAFTSYMAGRNTISFDRLKALRTMGNDVFFPPYVQKSPHGAWDAIPPYVATAWVGENHLAFLALLHNAYHRLLTARHERTEDKDEATTYLIGKVRDAAVQAHARFLFVWLQKDSQTKERYSQYLISQGIETLDCELPEGFTPRLRVGGVGHPNSDYHSHFAGCIDSWLQLAIP